MMRLGRPEHPPSKEQDDQTDRAIVTEKAITEEPKAGRNTLLNRLKMLWSNNKEKHDSRSNKKD